MKVAISASDGSLDSEVDPRFGRARFFLIVDATDGAIEVLDNRSSDDLPHGAGIAAVEALVRRGVSVVVTGRVGPKAERGLQAARVRILTGVSGGCREALIRSIPDLAPSLASAPEPTPA